ncbi:MAG: aminotransferase class V-fold PLP-dependent enzyme [Chloroflexi bacterium]|nr:aminotransferase class V-fold PLP-dependent enzyme [Chloroflexota bacterium]
MRGDFLLKDDVVFLNHGSYGACPREVFEIYQTWQRELEAEPAHFLGRRFAPVMKQARQDLAAYLGADADDLVYYPNATQGLNVVIQSLAENLPLVAGDEILSTSHEYGALDKAWTFVSEPRGVIYNRVELAPPFTTAEEFADRFLAHVGPRTRIVYLSHITSPTALRFPVELIVKRARALGVITVIDGAHAPGQVAINLTEIDADFYSGNCHKWLCAPKGSGFLHARRDMQKLLRPIVIGHGWRTTPPPGESVYVHEHQWRGTFDPASYLTVPAAIEFQAHHDWARIRMDAHAMATYAMNRLIEAFGEPPLSPPTTDWWIQMVAAPIGRCDAGAVSTRLYEDHNIVIPIIDWGERTFARISVQAYTTRAELDLLVDTLVDIVPKFPHPSAKAG